MTEPSKSQINKCGELVRKWIYEDGSISDQEVADALRIITDFRAAHAYPLVKVRLGLRSMVRTEFASEVIGQRLKRLPRIIRKLQRTTNSPSGRTALARLEDIGGVRAILRDGPELDRVRRRIEAKWRKDIHRQRDYIKNPKDIGYRAVHYVVIRDGRAIEVQLRTRGQQQWAEAAETADARLGARGVNLKDSEAPETMLEYFKTAGQIIYHSEYNLHIPSELHDQFRAARKAVVDDGYYTA